MTKRLTLALSILVAFTGCATGRPTTAHPVMAAYTPIPAGGLAAANISTGLTNTSGTITANLSTGVNGGQTAIGDTLTTGNLTLRPNGADTTTGHVIASGLGFQAPAGTATHPGVTVGADGYGILKSGNYTILTAGGSTNGIGLNSATVHPVAFGGLWDGGGETTVFAAVSNAATIAGSGGWALGVTASLTPTTTLIGTALTVASATSAVANIIKATANTVTITGSTAITTATGFNYFDIEAPTYTAASAVAITNAATFVIKGAPVMGGSATCTECDALWVQAGAARFDGGISQIGNSFATPGSGVIVTTNAPTGVVSLSLKYININVAGTATYILALQ